MPCRTLLISQEDFKDRVDLSENILSKYVIPNIALVQDRYLKKILCKDFYDEIIEQVEDSTLTSANETLLDDYIKPAMVYRSYARYLGTANVFSTPSGHRKFVEENSEAATPADMALPIKQAESDALYYESQLEEYLKNNEDDYETWRDNCRCVKKSITNFKISKIGNGYSKKNSSLQSDPFYNDYLDDNGNPK